MHRILFVKVVTAALILTGLCYGALIPPFFLDCVVALGYRQLTVIENPDGSRRAVPGPFVPMASGFLYGHFLKKVDAANSNYRIYLVTNEHVLEAIENAEKSQIDMLSKLPKMAPVTEPLHVFIRFNPKTAGPAREDLTAPLHDPDKKSNWCVDKDHDVAVVPIGADALQKAGVQFNYFQGDEHAAGRSKVSEIGLAEGDHIYVLGFPMGLVGGQRNFVITRQGVIARIRDYLAMSTDRFLIDALIFPGNSGGPVVSTVEASSIEGTKSQNRAYLLGVVRAYIPYRDVAVSRQSGEERVAFTENSGLAEVIPIDLVQALIIKQEEVIAAR
jgi:hypothetical protein